VRIFLTFIRDLQVDGSGHVRFGLCGNSLPLAGFGSDWPVDLLHHPDKPKKSQRILAHRTPLSMEFATFFRKFVHDRVQLLATIHRGLGRERWLPARVSEDRFLRQEKAGGDCRNKDRSLSQGLTRAVNRLHLLRLGNQPPTRFASRTYLVSAASTAIDSQRERARRSVSASVSGDVEG